MNDITQKELIQSIVDNLDANNTRFAFLLGAGASVTSGIPVAAALAKKWLAQLKTNNPTKYKEIEKHDDFDENNLANLYSKIYQARFSHKPEDGAHEIEKIMTAKNVYPSLGYIVLANFLLKTDNNVILTTNFDRLPETTLLTIFNHHAKTIYHEALLPHTIVDNKNPVIIKIHNDALFQPKNEKKDIETLNEDYKNIVEKILKDYCVIVLGYAGNDQEGLMQYLTEKADPNRIYWCYRDTDDIPKTVVDKKFHCVKIEDFDEFMVALYDALPKEKIFTLKQIQESITETAKAKVSLIDNKIKELQEKTSKPKPQDVAESKQNNIESFIKKFVAETWWVYQLKIDQETNIEKKDKLYQDGLQQYPKSSELMGNYANFLSDTRKDYYKAEKYYSDALEIDPDSANNNGNYANFLSVIRKDYDKAEQYHLKALTIEPNNSDINGNYAIFLKTIRKDYDKAEQYYLKALAIGPDSSNNNGIYAAFLNDIRKDYDKAEQHYLKALEIDPDSANNNGNYAVFLKNIRKDYDKAEQYHLKALTIEPNNSDINGNYASFLKTIRKDYDKAEQHYLKALEIDPDSANNNGNYAVFLSDIRKDYDKAEQYYLKALAIDPDSANNNGNYASFLSDIRKDYDKAEQYYLKALNIEPNNSDINGNYASFLLAQGRKQQALPYLEKAEGLANKDGTKIELLFYRLAHFPNSYKKNKLKLEKLLAKGGRSIGWNFSNNIAQAKKEGCSYIDELEQFAKAISTE